MKKAVVVTHVFGILPRPIELIPNVEMFIGSYDADFFLNLREFSHMALRLDDALNQTSFSGEIDDEIRKELGQYDEIAVLGIYKGLCHRTAFGYSVQALHEAGKTSGTLRIPTDCVARSSSSAPTCNLDPNFNSSYYWSGYDAIVASMFPDSERRLEGNDVVYRLG